MKESDLQRLVMDWLAAERFIGFRINQGGPPDRRGVPFVALRTLDGRPAKGVADIVAWKWVGSMKQITFWIELKAAKGKQSLEQSMFQEQVKEWGHHYVLARSLEDVQRATRDCRQETH